MPKAPVTRINGAFQVQANTATNNKSNGLYAPQLTTTQRNGIPTDTLTNGAIIYNTTLNTFQVYQTGAWVNLNSSLTTASGIGLAPGSSPVILPQGTSGAVEVPANNIAGFMYYDTTSNTFKIRTNTAWLTITAT